jgi:uracil-DNA glycosylase
VIVGQDPYPTPGYAHGLAFSVDEDRRPFPKSLQNIFAELTSDLGIPLPDHGNLERWSESGVMLLNRVLTVELGRPNAHLKLGWQSVTNAIAEELAKRDVVAVLWGKNAQELSNLFQYKVESPHPSPLSAYRGFFGSRPFSTVNTFLLEQGKEPIHW